MKRVGAAISIAVFGFTGLVLMVWVFMAMVNIYDFYLRFHSLPTLTSDYARAFNDVTREIGMDATWFGVFGPVVSFYALVATFIASLRH